MRTAAAQQVADIHADPAAKAKVGLMEVSVSSRVRVDRRHPLRSRRSSAAISSEYSDVMDPVDPQHLEALTAVVQRIVNESGDPVRFDARAWTLEWIHESVPALGGARPIDYMGTAKGRALVETLVLQMQSGAYS